MSAHTDSEVPGKPKRGVSRRGFIHGAGIGGGVPGTGLLDKKAQAAPAAKIGTQIFETGMAYRIAMDHFTYHLTH